jgi:iron complex transport system permease protein
LLSLALSTTVVSLAVGSRSVSFGELWPALASTLGMEGGGTVAAEASIGEVVVQQLRWPRTALGLLVGAALGVAGVLVQGHTRNPLAEPGLLGISSGAACGVVLALSTGMAATTADATWFALAGALAAGLVVFAIGAGGRRSTPLTLVLAGVAVAALLDAVVTGLVLLDLGVLDTFRTWSVGSVADRELDAVWSVLPFLVAGGLLALVNTRALNALALGEDLARGLGVQVLRARVVGVAAVTLLTGATVAAAGLIAFVGLVVPHAVRVVTGPDHRWLVPYAALAGASLLVAADVLGRLVARPAELPAALVMALVGAPVFIALVRRRRLVTP